MLKKRIIPVLLLHKGLLYKTKRFNSPVYIGDPINAIKIFNDKEVDELIILDIDASKENTDPKYKLIESIAAECFMPLCYGGGIKKMEHAETLFSLGIEKISLNNTLLDNEKIIREISNIYGSQSIIGSFDVKKGLLSYNTYNYKTTKKLKMKPLDYARKLEQLGVGEIFINNVDRDGMQSGYDINFMKEIASAVSIPVIACGGASKLEDCAELLNNTEVSAAGAGSMFVFYGKHNAVLITYPERKEIERLLD